MALQTSRVALALRGLAAAVAFVLVAVVTIAGSGGAFDDDPTVSTTLPASAGPVRADSPVQYLGVTVGRLAAVDGDLDGARLSLRMHADLLEQVPANVRARVLPRTLFGDQYIDLAVPAESRAEGNLVEGAVLAADTSGETVRLYAAYTRLYELITELRPADLQVALTALADALRGRGAEIGTMIDEASELAEDAGPLLDLLGEDVNTAARLGRDLAGAAPDLLASLDDAVALSRTVVAERQALSDLLTAGIELSGQSERLLADHADRFIQLVHATGPLAEAVTRHPGAVGESLDAADFFLDGAKRAFGTGRFAIDAALTFDDPYPYTAADCPRYPGLDGANCGDSVRERGTGDEAAAAPAAPPPPLPETGGLTGPVGGEREREVIRQLAPLLPDGDSTAEEQPVDQLSLLLGPLVRGTRVVVP
ncbi:virulence factor Mce family protein [Amycolatopsis marina]|uniref:Virulence factor Mce family protein n=1 Tax=Amycolatopsis marina TaxID=490629 RepID=A0A1I0ZTN9_9PSEU|nr:MCE family protein [Amycolatopsis marina]SFB28891.1 virulence factor Mce family protein [Amycolatopsis marina]